MVEHSIYGFMLDQSKIRDKDMNHLIRPLILFLVIALPAGSVTAEEQPGFTLTVWNIEGGINISSGYCGYITGFWKFFLPHDTSSINGIGTEMSRFATDIATLTEVENPSWRNRDMDHLASLCTLTGLNFGVFYHTSDFMGLGNQGNAIISRYPVAGWKEYTLPGGLEKRKLCQLTVLYDTQKINIFVTHLSQGLGRGKQIAAIAKVIAETGGPVILAGDFNTGDMEELQPVINAGLKEFSAASTCPSWKPSKALDHVFLSRHFEAISVTVPDVRYSDHLPIVAKVRLVKSVEPVVEVKPAKDEKTDPGR